MRVAAIERVGAPAVLKTQEMPVPVIGPHEVLIALHASGVGIWDADIRNGWWPRGQPCFPLVIGSDGAGTVAAVGTRVRRFKIGDRVWAHEFINPKGGFYAEFVAVHARNVGHVPRNLDLLHAGAAVATGLTALRGIDEVLAVRRNQMVLVYGATGAVGTLAVQFAKRRHAHVIATATGRKARALMQRLGADATFDARSDEAIAQLRSHAPHGLDAVIAFAGGKTLDRSLDLVRAGGRVAFPYGVEPEPKRRRRPFVIDRFDAESSPAEFKRLARAVEEARLQVPIAAVYPLSQAARAHQRLEQGGVLGRIVLCVSKQGRRPGG